MVRKMDDLISRQWLMKCVDEGWLKFDTETDENRFIHLVRDIAPSAQPEQSWIPCSERFPKDFEDVLVWYEYFRYGEYNRMYQTWDVGYYNSQLNIWGGGVTGQKVRAIAWMPLPEPAKEDDHETD